MRSPANNYSDTFIRLLPALLLIALLSVPGTLRAATSTPTPESIVAHLQQKYDALKSLSFTFHQRSEGQMSGRPRSGSGRAYFYKNGATSRMRWNYNAPDKQVLISDGTTMSMYFAGLNQMIVTPVKDLDSDLTFAFFSGGSKIGDKFRILPPESQYADDAPTQVVKLIPRQAQSQVQDIHLWVDANSLIRRIEIRDQFDTITVLNLSDIKENFLSGASRDEIGQLFSFTPPKGTEIIRR